MCMTSVASSARPCPRPPSHPIAAIARHHHDHAHVHDDHPRCHHYVLIMTIMPMTTVCPRSTYASRPCPGPCHQINAHAHRIIITIASMQ
eukprot:9103467-Lingulodinium_polyedra.AAC.1